MSITSAWRLDFVMVVASAPHHEIPTHSKVEEQFRITNNGRICHATTTQTVHQPRTA